MVAGQHLPERAVDVPGKVDDAAVAEVPQVDLPLVGGRDARKHVLHRQVGVGRDEGHR